MVTTSLDNGLGNGILCPITSHEANVPWNILWKLLIIREKTGRSNLGVQAKSLSLDRTVVARTNHKTSSRKCGVENHFFSNKCGWKVLTMFCYF